MFQDEARRGQKGTLTRRWAPRGTRPRVVRQTKYKWAYISGAVEPATGASFGMIATCVDTEMMDRVASFSAGVGHCTAGFR